MIDRIDYWHLGTRYVFVEAQAFRRSSWPGDHALELAPRLEARWVVESMARHDPSLVDRLCRGLDGVASMPRGYARRPTDAGDPRVERVLEALGVDHLGAMRGEASAFARIHLLRESKGRQPPSAPERPEARAIDQAIARLGSDPLLFRGDNYRVARTGTVADVPRRDLFEVLSETDLFSILRAWTTAPECVAAQKVALVELLALAEAQRTKRGRCELVLLRRTRVRAAPAGEGPVMTPSSLRAARERAWIAVEAVDQEEQPVAGVRVEFMLSSGPTTLTTDAAGMARLASVAPGSVTIRVTSLDGEVWRPVGGAPAVASGEQAGRTHVLHDGECLTKIAARYGFKGWQKLWEHPQNEGLRKRRSSPHVLAPGDVIAIPRLAVHEMTRETGAVHRIKLQRNSALVRLRLQDMAGNPLTGVSYDYGFGSENGFVLRPGSQATDDGWLEESIPLHVSQLEVRVRLPKLRFVFDLRRLHPARDRDTDAPVASGIAKRLTDLGYDLQSSTAQSSGPKGVALFQALQLQQENAQGQPDRSTLNALEGAYTV